MGGFHKIDFVDNGAAATITVDGEKIQNVIGVKIEREVRSPSIVTVTQRFYSKELSVHIEKDEIKERRLSDGQT